MTNKTLVVGATGNVGSGVLATLVARGIDVRGLAHSEASAAAVRDAGAEPAVGDLAVPGSLAPAFDGVDATLVVTRGLENQVEMAGNAIEAAKRAGVRRLVRLSASVPEPTLETILGRQHHEIDGLVERSGIPYTILKPTFFMQNIMAAASTIASDGMMYWPFGSGRTGMIDVRDIVDVAVEALTSHGHEGNTYRLTGPASISMQDVAAALSDSLGRNVTYVDVPVEAGISSMVEMGMPEFMAETFGELFVNFSQNGGNWATDDVERVSGHPARSIGAFARDFASAFAVASPA